MRITSSGSVGINTSLPSDDVEISTSADGKGLTIKNAGNNRPYLNFDSNRSSAGNNLAELHFKWNGTDVARIIAVAGSDTTNKDDGHITFSTSSTGSVDERMRLDSSGNLLVGKTTATDAGVGIWLDAPNGRGFFTASNDYCAQFRRLGNTGVAVYFLTDATIVGTISLTGSSTSYNTSSDYRLKTDAQPMTGASARVQALNPVNFEWIADGTRVDGFLAHEAQEVVPEAVTGTHNEVDADGNAVMQGIDQSKLVPLLTAALQEALDEITDLKARVATLEAN